MQKIDNEFLVTNRLTRGWAEDLILFMRCLEKYLDAKWVVPEEEGIIHFHFTMDVFEYENVPLKGVLNELVRYDAKTPEYLILDVMVDGTYQDQVYTNRNTFRTRFLSTIEFMNLYLDNITRWFHVEYCNTNITYMDNDPIKSEIANHIHSIIERAHEHRTMELRKNAFLQEHFHEYPDAHTIYENMADVCNISYVEKSMLALKSNMEAVMNKKA